MKTMTNLMAGLFLSSVFFTSCSKDSINTAEPSHNPAANSMKTAPTADGSVTPDGTIPDVKFVSGYVSTSHVAFQRNGTTFYTIDRPQLTDLFNPVNGRLESIYGTYGNLTITMKGVPYAPSEHSMYLRGEIFMEGERVLVEFMINQSIKLSAYGQNVIINDRSTFAGLMNLDMNRVVHNTQMNTWRQAQRYEGVIRISRESNPELYHEMLEGLRGVIRLEIY
jgi:hypothetical protein